MLVFKCFLILQYSSPPDFCCHVRFPGGSRHPLWLGGGCGPGSLTRRRVLESPRQSVPLITNPGALFLTPHCAYSLPMFTNHVPEVTVRTSWPLAAGPAWQPLSYKCWRFFKGLSGEPHGQQEECVAASLWGLKAWKSYSLAFPGKFAESRTRGTENGSCACALVLSSFLSNFITKLTYFYI